MMNRIPSYTLRLCALIAFLMLVGPHSVAQTPPASEQPPSRSGEAVDEPLDTFVPTEKVPADSAVAFPVDI